MIAKSLLENFLTGKLLFDLLGRFHKPILMIWRLHQAEGSSFSMLTLLLFLDHLGHRCSLKRPSHHLSFKSSLFLLFVVSPLGLTSCNFLLLFLIDSRPRLKHGVHHSSMLSIIEVFNRSRIITSTFTFFLESLRCLTLSIDTSNILFDSVKEYRPLLLLFLLLQEILAFEVVFDRLVKLKKILVLDGQVKISDR